MTATSSGLSFTSFKWGSLLGEGAYSRVLEASRGNDKFAIKVVDKQFVQRHKKVDMVLNEKRILSMLQHPNVVRLYHTFHDESSLYYVLELAPGGDMSEELRRYGRYPLALARFYTAELVTVLEYLHGRRVLHRDLKPENILFAADRHIKLADFGTAKIVEDAAPGSDSAAEEKKRRKSFVGTAEYVSPEVLRDGNQDKGVDLWALGCVLYQMLLGRPPFKGDSEYLTFQKIINRELSFPADVDPDLDPSARDLIEQLLVLEPGMRLGNTPEGYEKLRAHPFFNGIDFSSLPTAPVPALPPLPLGSALSTGTGTGAGSRSGSAPGSAREGGGEDADPDPDPDSDNDLDAMQTASVPSAGRAASPSPSPGPASSPARPAASSVSLSAPPWSSLLLDTESVVCSGLVSKKRGLFSRKRILVLTDLPRLVYIDPGKLTEIRGQIEWSRELWVEWKADKEFWVHTPRRVYHLTALSTTAKVWCDAINTMRNIPAATADADAKQR